MGGSSIVSDSGKQLAWIGFVIRIGIQNVGATLSRTNI